MDEQQLELYLKSKDNDISLSDEEILIAKQLYSQSKDTRINLKLSINKILYRLTPPTPEQYLNSDYGWLPKRYADGLFDHVKKDFCTLLDPNKNYTQAVLYGATRLGKSVCVRLIIHYIIIFIHCLRNPSSYYGLLEGTPLAIYIMSFVRGKVNQILLNPIYNILRMSPRFEQTKFQDKVYDLQAKNGLETIYWSKANDDGGHITLESGLTLHTGTDFLSFIGSDLLFMVVSEINFFIEQAGTTHEEIFKLYTEGVERIRATVGKNYLGMVYLDSSANDVENPIEKYINNDLRTMDHVYFKQRTRWDCDNLDRRKMKIWLKTKETFPVFVGNGTIPAKIINDDNDKIGLPLNLIKNVPIDVKKPFVIDIYGAIKNIIGLPTIKENAFITDKSIIDNIFVKELINIEGGIIVGAECKPELLIWNMVKDIFFTNIGIEHYCIKRASKEPRVIHIDTAYSAKGATYGFAMAHLELDNVTNLILYVMDMIFSFLPSEKGINLEAVQEFIKDLKYIGNVPLSIVTTDTFQHAQLKQNLERHEINTNVVSLERTIDHYQLFYTLMLQNQIRAGRNIFLKNNLRSLIRSKERNKEKVTHSSGKRVYHYNGNWSTSEAGHNMKDCSDCGAGVVSTLKMLGFQPTTVYQIENNKYSEKTEDIKKSVIDAYDMIHKVY